MTRATLVVLTFDQRELAVAAVESALVQGGTDVEVLVTVDAGDPETGRLIAERLREHRQGPEVVTIAPPSNRGPAWCYNEAIRRARGRYIAFLDGDDTWSQGMLTCQIAAIERAPAGVVGVVGAASYGPGGGRRAKRYDPDEASFSHAGLVAEGAKYPVLSALYSTEVMQSLSSIPEHYRVCDYFVAVQVTARGRLAVSDCDCGRIRTWAGSMRATSPRPGLTLDRLETVAEFIDAQDPEVRHAARLRERRLLNGLIRKPWDLPIERMRRYLARRPLVLRGYVALAAGWLAQRARSSGGWS